MAKANTKEPGSELAKAVIAVMKAVKVVDKNMTVGEGRMQYKGVADKDVKEAIGEAMAENGLVCLPIGVEPRVEITQWDETYNGQSKRKQSVFTEVKTRYLLLHESGESIELEGYGHGIDTQDKSAGKATTYALKNALLYAFLVPTGKIDDTDNTHSEEHDRILQEKAKAVAEGEKKRVEAVKNAAIEGLKALTTTDQFSPFKEANAEAFKIKEVIDFAKSRYEKLSKPAEEFANPAGLLKKDDSEKPVQDLLKDAASDAAELLPTEEVLSPVDEAIKQLSMFLEADKLTSWAREAVAGMTKKKVVKSEIERFKEAANNRVTELTQGTDGK
jgi:hypothetical protein